MSWLKPDASENMKLMFVALDTSQDPIFWLKPDASQNMKLMFVALDTSQDPI
jgi:hypothetical protein